ncbi:hypothetical protein FRB94_004472 [Tulasnella sp. JGI-2019a]|nr:hypothetical protein FRB93_005354 [Tulasnella sp. JGI-2019a]KAG9001876.1 hypothetical protein FRB94_004472 [Tulasnella sp. JGI-2019a]KAG9030396.1 hypothetical protein FRB95_003995 [Tulasnella sp. JGI-2019a]
MAASVSRPRTIQELASLATTETYDPSRSLKDSLRAADALRQQGKVAMQNGDLESAFVNTARAVTIIVEKIPKHPDYLKLTSQQKQNLAFNGNQLLETLGNLKLKIHDRHEAWVASGGEAALERAEKEAEERAQHEQAEREELERREYEEEQRREEFERRERQRIAEDERLRSRDEDMYRRRDAEERERMYRRRQDPAREQRPEIDPNEIAKEKIRLAKQRQMEEYQRSARKRSSEIRTDRRMKEDEVFAHVRTAAGYDRRSPSPGPSPSRDPPEHDWEAAQQQRPQYRGGQSQPRASPINYPSTAPEHVPYITPKRKDMDFSSLGPLPLESPTHAQYREPPDDDYDTNASRNGIRRPSYPAPVTTTSPGRNSHPIEYPKLMDDHQKQQGYIPNSILAPNAYNYTYSNPQSYYGQQQRPYPTIPSPTSPTSPEGQAYGTSPYPYPNLPASSSAPTYSYPLQRTPSIPALNYASPTRSSPLAHSLPNPPVPLLPPKVPITPPQPYGLARNGSFSSNHRISPPKNGQLYSPPPGTLRTVYLPQECLTKFLSIASINTARKKETCGLLLGKLNNHAYTVQTLLVPRQTSDENSCTMTEEEMVIEFQEKRDLITLGWIHTHPTQSCFMSSLDLHTHSGFQSALPEAFAIVCAPKSTPSFGIFRLTDPPGLQIIQNCNDKNLFHPHPDKPIYTDADSGHVKMADLPLSIADLRTKL